MKVGFQILENVGGMLKDVHGLTFVYVKQELGRFANRFKKKLAQDRMQGPPGINWYHAQTLKRSKHFKYYVDGNTLKSLAMVSKISGILMMHETGGTIRAKGSGWLYLFDRKAKYKWRATTTASETSGIVGKVKQVTLKPRLGFRQTFRSMIPEERTRLNAAMARALKVARERNINPKQILMNTKL